ncbi:MAG: FecR domain-containing protein, partial [Verrucomicrobiota bacterium]|nr:FecR domain-containing protein [Verrucomicrobiota bacterium]
MKKLFLSAGGALGALALGVVSANGQGSVMKEARVTQVVKDVKIVPAQAAPRPATTSDTVRGDTAVRTGAESRAELTFGDLTIARLGANTIFSFNESSRTVDLANGAILLRVPKGSGGAKIQTAAVTAAITGTTVIAEYHPKSYAKYLVLEGTMRIYLKGVLGESLLLHAGQMMILNPNAKRLSEPVDFDLDRLWKTSLFIQGFRPLGSEPLMAEVKQTQLDRKAAGELIDTNLVIFGRGTLVTMTDPQSTDVIDRKTAAMTLPTPTVPPVPTPTPTIAPSPTPTIAPSPTPTIAPSPTATPRPTPSKFGTPPPIVTSVPYPIDNGTTIQTDPAITRGGVTDFGKIYRDTAQDGPFSAWAFTATSPFDNTVAIDTLYGGNVPVAAFKFTALQLVGNPTISTANGGATNLALISVGPITAAPSGNTTFTFAGMQSVLIATQNGSINLSGLTFQNIPLLFFYARGAGSNLTLGSLILNSLSLRLIAENNIQIDATEAVFNGQNGGTIRGTAGGSLAVNGSLFASTASIPRSPLNFVGAGGTISLSALGGTLSVDSLIQVSSNDPTPPLTISVRRSASGGQISLDSGLTAGTGITLTSNARLLSLLHPGAPGPGGSITLTTPGGDIISNGATIQADRGTITIQHSSAPPVGTAQITLDGGTISSETLLALSRGDLNVGATTPVNLSAVTLSFLATRNMVWSGGVLTAMASASTGNVTFQSGNDITVTNAFNIQRSNGGITDGLNILLFAGRNFQANGGLTLGTDGSGLTTGGNITLRSGAAMNIAGIALFQTGPTTANQGSGSNVTISAIGPITTSDLLASVAIGAGRTLSNGGVITMTGTGSYTATLGDGGLNLQVLNSSPGIIGTGGNISLTLDGSLTTGKAGALNVVVNNSNGGRIQTGGNITSTIGTGLTANSVNVLIDNRFKGFIGSGAGITFSAGGTFTTTGNANFEILNSQSGTTGGTIVSDAFIKVTFANATIGADLNAFIDNSDGSIGGTGGSVTLQVNGKLAVSGRIDVFG